MNFARLDSLMNDYHIKDPITIFNLYESGFCITRMNLGIKKFRVYRGERGNIFKPNVCDNVTFMAVLSGTSQIMTPRDVLSGNEANYRKRLCGKV